MIPPPHQLQLQAARQWCGRTFAEMVNYARWTNAANVAALLLLFAGLFTRNPAVAAILILMPWAALALVGWTRGAVRIDRPRRESRKPNVAAVYAVPAFALSGASLMSVHVLRWTELIFPALLLALALLAATMWAERHLARVSRNLAPFVLFAAMYGIGSSVQANVLLDRSEPQVFRAPVQGKRVVRGKSTEYRLQLGEWGPRPEGSSVSVPFPLYTAAHPGTPVCIGLHGGALGIRWYTVDRCGNP
jgi:hypothetical protein